LPKDIGQGIAEGDLDPITKMPFEVNHQIVIYLDGYFACVVCLIESIYTFLYFWSK